jgi:hypothetical protein
MVYFCLLILLFFQYAICVIGSGGNIYGQTHFTNLEEFVAGNPVRITLNRSLPLYDIPANRWYVSCTGWYGRSQSNEKLGQFFLPNGNIQLTTSGGQDYFLPGPLPYQGQMPVNKVVRDIDALVFHIEDETFLSETFICPKVISKYIGLFGYYAFLLNENNSPRLSLEVALPIISNRNLFKADEVIYKQADSGLYKNQINSLLAGLTSDYLLYQKWNFAPDGMERTQALRIEFNLAYNYVLKDILSVQTYAGVLVPLHRKNVYLNKENIENRFIFYPQNISSEFVGFQYGTVLSMFLYQNDFRTIKFIFGNNLIYFLPHDQVRSFDLVGRSWSRYLPVYKNLSLESAQETTLVNDLTYVCRVSPNFYNIATIELDYMKEAASIGIGYCLYGRQSESVTILDDIGNIMLKGTNQDITHPVSLIRSVGLRLPNEDVQVFDQPTVTKNTQPNVNYYYAKINNNTIDIASATHPAIFAGEVYLKGTLDTQQFGSFSGGISCRFCHNNAAIQYTALWGSFEIGF